MSSAAANPNPVAALDPAALDPPALDPPALTCASSPADPIAIDDTPAGDAPVANSPDPQSSNSQSPAPKSKRSLYDRTEAFISRLTSRSTLAHRIASLIWLPYAFKSGIKIKRESDDTFSALLPFRKFNRNWYNAMAGASLLANSEIAGGMYIYGRCGGDYTVVCKNLAYKFLRPCFGPAIYRCKSLQDLDSLLKTGGEFNFDIELDVVQHIPTRGLGREIRVGKCTATFHITPKAMHAARAARRAKAPVTSTT